MKYTCSHGETWDIPALKQYGEELMCDYVRENNSYYFSDLVSFDGGEIIDLPDEGIVTAATIAPPWEPSTSYIVPPWGE